MKVTKQGSVRVDLVGGTLDLQPIAMILKDVVTINMATQLKAKVVIEENVEEHFFTISISESNVAFNFFVEYYGKKLFKLENKQHKDE